MFVCVYVCLCVPPSAWRSSSILLISGGRNEAALSDSLLTSSLKVKLIDKPHQTKLLCSSDRGPHPASYFVFPKSPAPTKLLWVGINLSLQWTFQKIAEKEGSFRYFFFQKCSSKRNLHLLLTGQISNSHHHFKFYAQTSE